MKTLSEQELRDYTGSLKQVAGIRRCVLDDGKARGIRAADVYNGSGLAFTVLLDRGLDIGAASYKGQSLTYFAPGGFGHPAYHEAEGFGWLRNWGVGLLNGCGLTHAGFPEPQDGFPVDGPHGLHGRLSNTPAQDIVCREEWMDGKYQLTVEGTMLQSSVLAEHLECRRTIRTALGEDDLRVTDCVTNRASTSSPLMALYHVNLGYPLVSENSRYRVCDHDVQAFEPNAPAAAALDRWAECQPPTQGFEEQVFYHDVPAEDDGMARMTLENPDLGLAVCVGARKAELPRFYQWKMMSRDEYVTAIEPSNCDPRGLAWMKENDNLRMIEPGETVEFALSIAITTPADAPG